MVNLAKQSTNAPGTWNLDPEGRRVAFDKVYLGFVRDYKDGMFMGRLLVYIPEVCGKDDDTAWIICDYVSPFGGNQNGTSYGMWALPQNGAQVLVTFINGDPNRAVWLGCLFGVDQHRQVPNTRTGSPPQADPVLTVQPIYTSAANSQDFNPSITTPAPQVRTAPADPAAEAYQRAAGTTDPATRTTSRGSDNSYHVLGIRTPGGHGFTLSDQQGAAEIRLQTFNNMQIIMNAQSGNITIITGEAKSRIEVCADGNVNVFGDGSINIAAQENLNLHAMKNVNINAGEKLNMRSGGSMHVEAIQDMNFRSDTNIFHTSRGEQHRFSVGHIYDTTAQTFYRRANSGIRDSVTQGDINVKTYGGNIKLQSVDGNLELVGNQQVNVESLAAAINIKSADVVNILGATDVNLRSNSSEVNITGSSNVNVRGNSGLVLLFGQQGVAVDPVFYLNTGRAVAAPQAAEASGAGTAIGAESATAAVGPQVYGHPNPGPRPGTSLAGGGAGGSAGAMRNGVITSVAPIVPVGETSANRYQSGPGFSQTDTVGNGSGYGREFFVGQVQPNQRVPLQVMGYIDPSSGSTVTQETLSSRTDFTWQMRLAVAAMESRYGLRPTPEGAYRASAGGSQHYAGGTGQSNAADFSLRGLPEATKQQIVNDVISGVRSGSGPFRFIRAIGTYDTNANLLHIDARTDTGNKLVAWGANGRYAAGASDITTTTPAWFQAAVIPGGSFITGAAQIQTPRPATAEQTPADSTGTGPKRYIGIGYTDGKPDYAVEDIPNGTMKPASEYTGEYDGLSPIGFESIRNFETLRGPWPTDISGKPFRNACATASGDMANQPPTGGIQMIGYAHRLTEQELENRSITIEGIPISFDAFTEEQAIKLLKQDLKPVVQAIKSNITNELTQQQFDALVDFAWNIGVTQFVQNSGIVELIRDKKYDRVPNAMISWVDACGDRKAVLVSRRLFNAHRWSGVLRADSPVSIGEFLGDASRSNRNVVQGENARIAYEFFIAQGYSPAVAAGIVGNLIQESSIRPTALNSGENAQGIAQWTPNGGRQQRVAGFLGVNDVRNASLQDQLRAVHWELTNPSAGDRQALQAGTQLRNGNLSVAQAADIFNQYYERSTAGIRQRQGQALTNNDITDIDNRRANAQAIYNRFLQGG